MQVPFFCLLAAVAAYQPAPRAPTAPAAAVVSRAQPARCALGPLEPAADALSASQQQQQQQQSVDEPREWGRAAAHGALSLLTAVTVLGGGVAANAENELALLANQKSTSELVDPQCFAKSCKSQMEACSQEGDCAKGLLCTAKCMGDAQCTVGCFARYNNVALEQVLQCTIEDAGCIAIATQAPGADSLDEAPAPPKALVKATPASMSGRWYKVMGFNPNYDCFECQRNSFAASADGSSSAVRSSRPAVRDSALDISPGSAAVQVEYAMPRARAGMPPETYHSVLNEKLEFDAANSKRTAHTEGRMFGLTFWENWYVIGENAPREPEFKLVYYTGKTLQNRYEGAFVYARKPELPAASMPSIYKLAREAGLEPSKACCIDNSCFNTPVDTVAQPPLFTPVAEAGVVAEGAAAAQGGGGYAAADGPAGAFAKLTAPVRNTMRDVTELLEDPKPYGDDLFSRQRLMTEVREYDINGFRTLAPKQQ